MPYKKYTEIYKGHKSFVLKNIKTGKITHYTSEKNRATGIRIKEAFKHGFKKRGK